MTMRTLAVVAFVFAAVASPAHAQAPNRADAVARITAVHPEFFGSDDTRRDGLKTIVCELNKQDGGAWGELSKNDQGGRIPADIIVWGPTREHFDVLTDTGPFWGSDGVLTNPAWQWLAVACAPPPPVFVPPTPPAQPPPIVLPSNAELIALIEHILDNQQQALVVAKDTNARVASMDRTLTQTLGSVGKFLGKYVAPAIGGYLMAIQLQNNPPPAVEPAK